jgi:PTH1 family peptidyl-tRNA hydrolase
VRLRTRPQSVDRLIVGLGNPGSQYARTRHNVGYLVLDELARRHGFSKPARAFSGRYAAGEIHGVGVGLLTPTTFMNDSGRSVAAAVRELKLGLAALLIVHDHIDLAFGRLRLQHDGGHGGHNGLKSVHGLLGVEFDRLRVGVDRPPTTDPDIVADYVLSPFPESRAEVDELVRRAADAVEIWLRDDLETAMQTVNGVSGPSAPSAAGRPDR